MADLTKDERLCVDVDIQHEQFQAMHRRAQRAESIVAAVEALSERYGAVPSWMLDRVLRGEGVDRG